MDEDTFVEKIAEERGEKFRVWAEAFGELDFPPHAKAFEVTMHYDDGGRMVYHGEINDV